MLLAAFHPQSRHRDQVSKLPEADRQRRPRSDNPPRDRYAANRGVAERLIAGTARKGVLWNLKIPRGFESRRLAVCSPIIDVRFPPSFGDTAPQRGWAW